MRSTVSGQRGPVLSAGLIRGATLGLRVVVGLVFASQLGAAEAGTYFLAVAISSLAALVAMGGLDRLALAEVARAPLVVQAIATRLGRYVFASSLTMTVIVATIAIWSGMPKATILIVGLAIGPTNATRLAAHALRGQQSIRSSMVVGELLAPLLRLVVFALLPMELDANRASVAYLAGWVVAAVAATIVLRSGYPAASPTDDWMMGNLWRKIRPLFLFSLSSQFQSSFGTGAAWVVGLPPEVGALGAADRLDQMSLLPTTATRFATAPKLVTSGNVMEHETRWLATRTATESMLLQVPVLILIFVFAPTLLNLLGPDFEPASGYVRILLIGSLINALTGSTTQALLMSDQRHLLTASSLTGVAVLVTVALVLAPLVGVIGVVIALTGARSTTSIVEWWLVRSSLGARVDVLAARSRIDR